jgi:hypothetical protein
MNRRTLYRPRPEPPRTRTLAARPGRLTVAGLGLVTLIAALLLVWTAAAQASVWVIPAASRAYPGSRPGPQTDIRIDAAQNEYQGVQVCLNGGQRTVRFSWSTGSDPVIVQNTKLQRVYYVKVTTPTSDMRSKKGWYPDPVVPVNFDRDLAVPGPYNPGPTTPFYLLTHVPAGTPSGDHYAVLHVQNGAETTDIQFTLHVWDFGWSQISTHTAFAVSQQNLERSVQGKVYFGGEGKSLVLQAFYGMMKEHGISPTIVGFLPKTSNAGNIQVRDWVERMTPFLGSGGLDLSDNQLPLLRWFPWGRSENPSWATIGNYLEQVTRTYKDNGWEKKAYVYVLDETTHTWEERLAERYARVAHAASAKSGYRVRFLLTDDPRPHSLGGVKNANTFLNDDVDIWCLRYYYFFGRIPTVRDRQRAGSEIWWYSYPNGSVARTPSFVIDKPHIDSRAWGWLMQQWNVDGLLNYGFNRWGKATSGEGWRDPYQNPLSLIKGRLRCNGDTCLVYPGYYPRYGLNDPYAAPVSSLRLEALRDGLEEREYMKQAVALGGAGLVDQQLKMITRFDHPIRFANVFAFPTYSNNNATYDNARAQLAAYIESHLTPQ